MWRPIKWLNCWLVAIRTEPNQNFVKQKKWNKSISLFIVIVSVRIAIAMYIYWSLVLGHMKWMFIARANSFVFRSHISWHIIALSLDAVLKQTQKLLRVFFRIQCSLMTRRNQLHSPHLYTQHLLNAIKWTIKTIQSELFWIFFSFFFFRFCAHRDDKIDSILPENYSFWNS